MVDIHSIARRLAAEREGRKPPPVPVWLVPVWVYLLLAFAVLLSCIALGLIDHSRSG
jgi:hypothetical protein